MPFQKTAEIPLTKPVPFTVSVKPPDPAVVVAGINGVVIVGFFGARGRHSRGEIGVHIHSDTATHTARRAAGTAIPALCRLSFLIGLSPIRGFRG